MSDVLRWRQRRGRIERLLAPGYGCCERCGRPWKFAELHSTHYDDYRGVFPLCEPCWAELSPQGRLPFYEALVFGKWETQEDWPAIKSAVLVGQ